MAQFNLNDYETVEERLKRFWADPLHSDARIISYNRTTPEDRARGYWVIETHLYLCGEDQATELPKTTGWAFEIEGGKGANAFAALENAETSSIGRCLANYSMSGNKRSSREEMAKVARNQVQPDIRDWLLEGEGLVESGDLNALRLLYTEAQAAKVNQETLDALKHLGYELRK